MKSIRFVAGLLTLLAMGGCFGGEPSEKEMAQALHGNMKFRQTLGVMAMLGNMPGSPRGGSSPEQTINDLLKAGVVEKSSCAAAQGMPGYVCDFRWGSKLPNGPMQYGTPVKARFYKSNDAWTVDL